MKFTNEKINFRDGVYVGTFLGFIIHYFFIIYLNKALVNAQLSAEAYYEEEFSEGETDK